MTVSQRRSAGKKRKEDNLTPLLATDSAVIEHEFRDLVQKVELRDVYLRETRAALTSPPSEEATKGSGDLLIKPTQTRAKRIDKTLLYCGVRFDIVSEDGPELPFGVTVFAEYGLLYDIPADLVLNKETAALFARRNAVFNAWPFFRELVYTTVGRMGIPSVVLPTFRLPPAPP